MPLAPIDEIRRWYAHALPRADALTSPALFAHVRDVGRLLEALDLATEEIGSATTIPIAALGKAYSSRDEHLASLIGWNGALERAKLAISSALLRAHIAACTPTETRAAAMQALTELRRSAV